MRQLVKQVQKQTSKSENAPNRPTKKQSFNFKTNNLSNKTPFNFNSVLTYPVQPKLEVGNQDDIYEKEADKVANSIVFSNNPQPSSQLKHRKVERQNCNNCTINPMKDQNKTDPGSFLKIPRENIRSDMIREEGRQFDEPTKKFMEPRFGYDLSNIRIHTDSNAARSAKSINALAYTIGNNIVFGPEQYRPNSVEGKKLIAHEITHVLQQDSKIRRKPDAVAESQSSEQNSKSDGNTESEKSSILDFISKQAENLPGFTMLTIIIGHNPITQAKVERTPVKILQGFIELIPGGKGLFEILQQYNVTERIANWIDRQINELGITYDSIVNAVTNFTKSLGAGGGSLAENVFNFVKNVVLSPSTAWQRAKEIFTPFITRIEDFGKKVATQSIAWLKETFMAPLSDFCHKIPGYKLVTVLLGHDPFTNTSVPHSALNVVEAFAEFIPGGTEKVQQLKESKGLQKAYEWFIQETQTRNLTWARIAGTFAEAWSSLQLKDVLAPIETIERIGETFKPLMGDLVEFAKDALIKLLEVIYEAVMGAGGARVLSIIKKAKGAFQLVIRDPVGFLGNLVKSVTLGIRNFGVNMPKHLQTGVTEWLTGTLSSAGVEMPTKWDLQGILKLVMSVLGITWTKIRGIAVKVFGPTVISTLETTVGLVMEIKEKGFVQTMKDHITEYFSGLKEMMLDKIKTFIQETIVMAGIKNLASLLTPVGAVIQAIIKTYETIEFFIEKINKIMDFVESILDSINSIAGGSLGAAAEYIEKSMARTIPLILDFMASLLGLGDLSGKIKKVIEHVQSFIEQKIEQAMIWIKTKAMSLIQAGKEAIGSIVEWWKQKQAFKAADGTDHEIYLQKGSLEGQVMVASKDPKPLAEIISKKVWNKETIVRKDLATLKAKSDSINSMKNNKSQKTGEDVKNTYKEIIDILEKYGTPPPPTNLEDHQPTHGKGIYEMAKTIKVRNLSINPGKYVGSRPVNQPLVTELNKRWPSMFVAGHIVNEQLHGPGVLWNLTPITKKTNSDMKIQAEQQFKEAIISKGKVINYDAEVKYPNDFEEKKVEEEPDSLVTNGIEFINIEEVKFDNKSKKWKGTGKPPYGMKSKIPFKPHTDVLPGFGKGPKKVLNQLSKK